MLYYNPHTKEIFSQSEIAVISNFKSNSKVSLYPYRIERDYQSLGEVQTSLGIFPNDTNTITYDITYGDKNARTNESEILQITIADVDSPLIGWAPNGEPELQEDGTYVQKLAAYNILRSLQMQAVEGIPILIKEQLIQRMGVGNIDFTLGQAILDKLVAAKALLTTSDATTIITTDNGRHTVTADDIDDILEAINAYKQYIYDTADEYRTKLLSANSIEELNAVPNPFTTIAKYGTV